ncbi:hypothetical protein RJ639_017151 [Escallonia herrerae]|uniref:Transposase-associated domain-containing protein n=1 Tax=Escallonia herrerae TaxID=1293975 RepID=A0AA88VCY1_9ASTE|nr:hypothetical protein RJ639_017151 [Escallonia herrerae]
MVSEPEGALPEVKDETKPQLYELEYEFYVDELVIKSKKVRNHLANLRVVFERCRKYKLKMNKKNWHLESQKDPNMDKEWLNMPRASQAYHQGVNRFLDFASRNMGTSSGEILCPCTSYDLPGPFELSGKGAVVVEQMGAFFAFYFTKRSDMEEFRRFTSQKEEEERSGWWPDTVEN